MTERPRTATEAKALGEKRYFTGEPCRRGHVAERFASTRQCAECLVQHKADWRGSPENAAKDLAYSRAYNAENWEDRKRAAREDYHDNREQRIAQHAAWREENRDSVLAYSRAYKTANKAWNVAHANAYRARKLCAVPPWADMKAIERLYEEARRMTEETGVIHEVDHIFPLKGKHVSGLHVEANLQVIPAQLNRRKYNKTDLAGYAACGAELAGGWSDDATLALK
jgi:hypothetical protein